MKEEPVCENCGKPLYGRADKRFCNDGCRNTFNRNKGYERKAGEHENVPEILRIIKANYTTLKSIGDPLDNDSYYSIEVKSLINKGFNFNFHTSTIQEDDKLWKFCFERGWYVHEDGSCSICDRPEQANI